MKLLLLSLILFTAKTTSDIPAPNKYDIYAETAIVSDIRHQSKSIDLITVTTATEIEYSFYADSGSWDISDYASLLMYTNGTEIVTDDKVLEALYSGVEEHYRRIL